MTDIVRLRIADLDLTAGAQSRAVLDQERVERYAEHLEDLPPIVVFQDGSRYIPADGYHRIAAFRLAKRPDIDADVKQGTARDAVWFSLGANKKHNGSGLPLSRGDVTRAIERALTDVEWAELPDTELAEHIGCGHAMVSRLRQHLSTSGKIAPRESINVTRNGKTYPMSTAKIGRARKSEEDPPLVSEGPIDIAPRLAERRATVAKLYGEKRRVNDIARELGVHSSAVVGDLEAAGLRNQETRNWDSLRRAVAQLSGSASAIETLAKGLSYIGEDAEECSAELAHVSNVINNLQRVLKGKSKCKTQQ